jgi:hypothetical protein
MGKHESASGDSWHLRPRAATTRDGKAVGDVPMEGEAILYYIDGVADLGTFHQAHIDNDEYGDFTHPSAVDGHEWYDWEVVDFWYSLPTIATDDDGNMELPF